MKWLFQTNVYSGIRTFRVDYLGSGCQGVVLNGVLWLNHPLSLAIPDNALAPFPPFPFNIWQNNDRLNQLCIGHSLWLRCRMMKAVKNSLAVFSLQNWLVTLIAFRWHHSSLPLMRWMLTLRIRARTPSPWKLQTLRNTEVCTNMVSRGQK